MSCEERGKKNEEKRDKIIFHTLHENETGIFSLFSRLFPFIFHQLTRKLKNLTGEIQQRYSMFKNYE